MYCNASIKVLDMPNNNLNDMECAEILRNIIRRSQTRTDLNLSGNVFARIAAATQRQLYSEDRPAVSILTQTLTSSGVGVLLETTEQSSHITDLDLLRSPIRYEGARHLAKSLGNNALPNLTRLCRCDYGDDGFIAVVSALEENTSLLLHLDVCHTGIPVMVAMISVSGTFWPWRRVYQR